jgi:membrane associated rhomboid family serine protease
MFIPLKDENPTRITPLVNYALILANVIVFLYQATLPIRTQAALAMTYGTVPNRIAHLVSGHGRAEGALVPLFTSMFLHAGIAHLLGNMLFLWIFGDNVEEFFGHIGYLAFYLFCGIASALVHVSFNLHASVPAVGASGAISGVMGAYILLFPRARILTLVLIFLVPLPAFLILGYWFVLQFAAGVSSFGASATGGVAWWAHVGGFLTGLSITAFANRSN